MTRKLISILSSIIISFFALWAKAQPGLHITSSNITGEVSQTASSIIAPNCILSLFPSIKARANGPFTPSTPTLPSGILSNMIQMKIIKIGGVNLLSGVQENPLTTSDVILFSAVAGLLQTGPVEIQYRIPALQMTQSAWNAGSYTTGLSFTFSCLGSNPLTNTFTLTVDPFTTLSPISDISLNVNDFKYFRNTPVTGTHTLNSLFTVPLGLNVATLNSTFNYENGYIGAINPNTNTSNLAASITNPITYSPINLDISPQPLTPNGGITVPLGNSQTTTVNYKITPTNLVAGFLQAGTYSTTLKYQAYNAGGGASTNVAQTANLKVTVSDMGSLAVNNTEVALTFGTENDYINGTSTNIQNHLTISKTSAYDVYVKASSDNLLTQDNEPSTIPVNCITIGPGNGQAGLSTVILSSTAQKIISGAGPCLDRNIDIKYSIPADKIGQILGHRPGTYSTRITYSFVAL